MGETSGVVTSDDLTDSRTSLITIKHPWRYIYYVAIALIGTTLLLAFLTFPETNYTRSIEIDSEGHPTAPLRNNHNTNSGSMEKVGAPIHVESGTDGLPKKKTYVQRLQVFSGIYTQESLFKLFCRPFALIILPPVLWSSLVQSVTIGFIVAVTSNVASAYSTAYNFLPWQTGLCFIAAIIGALIGVFCGGSVGDMTADFFTKRNGGVREPEMRLPAIVISLITTPLALLLYGVGIQNNLHWICPTIGLALRDSYTVEP